MESGHCSHGVCLHHWDWLNRLNCSGSSASVPGGNPPRSNPVPPLPGCPVQRWAGSDRGDLLGQQEEGGSHAQ